SPGSGSARTASSIATRRASAAGCCGCSRCWRRSPSRRALPGCCDGFRLRRAAPRSGPAIDQRMTLITLGVADLEASRAFYERLGWRRSVEKAEGVAFYQANIVLALYSRQSLAEDLG